jgi:hypothetical protein
MVLPETGLKVGYVWRIWSEFRWLARTRLLATTAMPHRRGSGLAGYLPSVSPVGWSRTPFTNGGRSRFLTCFSMIAKGLQSAQPADPS